MNKIFAHSCERMTELADNSVALTVTSPPYWNAIDYDRHAEDARQNYRTRQYENGYRDYEEYLDWLEQIFKEVYRVTKPGGFCAVVIGTVLLEGRLYPVPFDFVARLSRQEWEFHQDIIWHKCTAGVRRAGVAIQKPYPGYYYPNIMNEYILVFRKPGPKIYEGRTAEEKEEATYPINRLFTMDIANNIWHIAPVPPNTIPHPAPFPEEIPYRLIQLYSYPGDLVLDPFVGSGQTIKVAHHLGRRYVGYEVIPQYVALAEQRLTEPLRLRKEQLVAVFEKVPMHARREAKRVSAQQPSLFTEYPDDVC
ncbi:MAG: site-specific DNA-methyltransferase [Ardenticatenia bacterium]|nr:MAG: site-specific DNA-methyltransferase [Ardenticatenia bacterium]